jgi:putative molybdopterin biosynthesis protein
MVRSWGAEAKVYPIVPDKFDQIKDMVAKAAEECDMVILNAGSSAGREDYSAKVIHQLGQVLYHGIAMKPGKPAILGCQGSKPILGVPGYPVSGIIVIEELLKPLVDHWLKAPAAPRQYAKATLTRPVVSGLKYEEFVRVRMGYVGSKLMASPLSRGSGVVSSFMKADGILEVPQGLEGFEAGEEVNVRLLSPVDKLENTLVVIGSHDPLLDELGDMLHLENNNVYMSSSHVGSMGGIMAIRRGEAHAAGCHLLNTENGEYNIAFIKKYFPKGGVKLIRCVGRQQGMMVAKGNPLNIQKFPDIARAGVRYVNRQKGSGTRILTDYLCKQEGLDANAIYGYDREELTHTSVAAQIASGSADAGMGIYSAAKLYDLDFINVCIEEYDLIIPDHAWDTPMVQQLLVTLKSDAFKEKILSLGGYTVENPGQVIEIK